MSNDWGADVPLPGADDDDGSGFGPVNDGFDDFDVGGVDGDKIGSGQLRIDRKGWYQLAIEATAKPKPYHDDDITKSRKPSIGLRMVVQASDNGTPVGAVHYHDIILGGYGPGVPLEDYDRDQTLNFLVGCGILKKDGDKVIDPETGTTKIKSSTLANRLNGLVVIGKLELTPARTKMKKTDEKDEKGKPVMVPELGKDGQPIVYAERIEFPWGRGVFHPLAKEVAHHRWVDENALKAAGINRTPAKANV